MQKITRGALIAGAGAVAVGVGIALNDPERTPRAGDALIARRVREVPLDNPRAGAWVGDGETVLPLVAQQLAVPKLAEANVPDIRVAALHDGITLALRLSWEQGLPNELSGISRFQDAVAVMLPAVGPAEPPVTMGAAGKPVHILQWRASWQRDVELGRSQGVVDEFPNVVRDLDPGDILPPEQALLYTAGRAAGNLMSAAKRTTPVEEVVAEGFGSTTSLEQQRAGGAAVHAEGRWWTVISLPMSRGGGLAPITAGGTWPVAFAVWSGGDARNRGGRKHYAAWTPMAVAA
ncbi:MAG: ethylbenzene dehydrogenase-related protein [Thermoleophilia bacterium]